MLGRIRGSAAVFIILILACLALAGGLYYLFQREQAKSASLQRELEALTAEKGRIEAQLDETQKKAAALEEQLDSNNAQLANLRQDADKERNAKEEALAQAAKLQADLEKEKSERLELENKLSQLQKDTKSMKGRLEQLEARRTELEDKLKELEAKNPASVELGEIVVNTENAPLTTQNTSIQYSSGEDKLKVNPTGPLEGKVLVVNKDYSFAVIDLGAKNGVKVGDVFSVYHDNKNIGDIKIEKIHDSMSAAGFVAAGLKNKISENDKVVTKTR